jgi:hypothetical protein
MIMLITPRGHSCQLSLLGNPQRHIGATKIIVFIRAWICQNFAAVSHGARVIGTEKSTASLAANMYILNRLGILYAKTAVGGSEEIITALIGKLYCAIFDNDVYVFGQKDRAIDEPEFAIRIDT